MKRVTIINGYTISYYYNLAEHKDEWHVSHSYIGYCGYFNTLEDAKEYCING